MEPFYKTRDVPQNTIGGSSKGIDPYTECSEICNMEVTRCLSTIIFVSNTCARDWLCEMNL